MRKASCSSLTLFISAILFIILAVHCKDINVADWDLKLTHNEKLALEKFRDRVRPIVPHNYMKEDSYIINFLRAKNFNVNEAERFLKQNLNWRKEYGMDRILNEDFSDILKEYPVYIDSIDKLGAPVATASTGTYNLRRAVLNGFTNRLIRMLYKLVEESCRKVRKAQLEGKRVTRFQLLVNLQGFNLITHGCPRCILATLDFIQQFEKYFPGMVDQVVIINAPPTFELVRPAVNDVLTERSRARIKIFGANKAEWQRYLLRFIDANQLTREFGGTRIRT